MFTYFLWSFWYRLVKSKNSVGALNTLQAIETKLPLIFMFLGHEDDDISLAVSEFARDYVGILKQVTLLTVFTRVGWKVHRLTKKEYVPQKWNLACI